MQRRAGDEEVLPLFPLGTVLVPGLVLPLQVFEPRYVTLLHDLARRAPDDQRFGVVAIRSGHEVGADRAPQTYSVGTAAALTEVRWRPDGRAVLTTHGTHRFQILGEVAGAPYRQARVGWLDEPDGEDPVGAAALVRHELAGYLEALGRGSTELPERPTPLSYAVVAASVLDLGARQTLLELPDTTTRLRAEARLLRRERALLARLPSLPAVDLPRSTPDLN